MSYDGTRLEKSLGASIPRREDVPSENPPYGTPNARMQPAEFAAFGATLRAINTVDPTAWTRGHDNLSAITDSARALLEHRRTLTRLAGR